MTPLVGNQGIIVNINHVYSSWVYHLQHFCPATMSPTIYLANPPKMLRTITQGRCKHDGEEVCGVTVVAGASTVHTDTVIMVQTTKCTREHGGRWARAGLDGK
jgi:hypothetical protein